MGKKVLGIKSREAKLRVSGAQKTYKRPAWVTSGEEELCVECFKVVGDRSRYSLVCMLGKAKDGMTVGELTEKMRLRQPTVTHHLQVLSSVDAVTVEPRGRERVYRLNRGAHCFDECKIPY